MVTTTLDVEREEVQPENVVSREQLFVQTLGEVGVERLRSHRDHGARVIGNAVSDHRRLEEGTGEVEPAGDLAVGVQRIVYVAHQRVAETKRGCGERVGDGGINVRVVEPRVALGQRQEAVCVGVLEADDHRQPLVVDNVLPLGAEHTPRLLVEPLVVPARVSRLQLARDPVVFAHPDGVYHGQQTLLVDARVAGVVAGVTTARFVRSRVKWQQPICTLKQEAIVERAYSASLLCWAAVHVGGIDESAEFIEGRRPHCVAVGIWRRQGAHQVHTPLAEPAVERIVGRDRNRDALRMKFLCRERATPVETAFDSGAVRQPKDQRMREIMVNKLAQLHQWKRMVAQFVGEHIQHTRAD